MNWKKSAGLLGVLLTLSQVAAWGQTNISTSSGVKREGQVVSPEKLTVTDTTPATSLRPARAERQQLPAVVEDRVQHFRTEARAYLVQQEQLKKKLAGANDKERAAIREQIKQLRSQWLEQAREMRKEFRQRQQELMEKLPDYREVIDSARNAAQQQALQAQQEIRRRRGSD